NAGTLQMEATVLPANASNQTYTWSVDNTGIATINTSGVLTAVSNGTVVVTATANDASGVTGTASIIVSNQTTNPILVTSIAVQGQGGVSVINTNAGTLQMDATVLPANATNQTYTWSVNNPAIATINGSGMLTGVTNGMVIVTATANDASGVTGSTNILVSNQTTSLEDISNQSFLSLYPNPAKDLLTLNYSLTNANAEMEIFDLTGRNMSRQTLSSTKGEVHVNTSTFQGGVYVVVVKQKGAIFWQERLIIE
ncbi:MAG: Ig-like domain-containing protein, partial [Bacteroidota bacterium]